MGGVVRGGEESISGDDWDGRASQLVVQYTIISKSQKVREQQVRVNGGKWEMGNGKESVGASKRIERLFPLPIPLPKPTKVS